MEKESKTMENKHKALHPLTAAITIIAVLSILCVLSGILGFDFKLAAVMACIFITAVAMLHGYTFQELITVWNKKVQDTGALFMIYLGIGSCVAGLMMSGSLQIIVSWLAQVVTPSLTLPLGVILTLLVALVTGSSFAAMGTIGIIVLAVAQLQGIPAPYVCAALVCGAGTNCYYSPFNDAINAYPMFYKDWTPYGILKDQRITSLISTAITVVIFFVIGMRFNNSADIQPIITQFVADVHSCFNTSVICLVPMLLIIVLCLLKADIVISFFITAFCGILIGVVFQGYSLHDCVAALWDGYSTDVFLAGKEVSSSIQSLCNRGGMTGFMSTIVFVLCLLYLVGTIGQIGVFDSIKKYLFNDTKSVSMLNFKTFICCTIGSTITLDGIPSILLTKEMLDDAWIKKGYSPKQVAIMTMATANWAGLTLPWSSQTVYFSDLCGVSPFSWMFLAFEYYIHVIVLVLQGFIAPKSLLKLSDVEKEAYHYEESAVEEA